MLAKGGLLGLETMGEHLPARVPPARSASDHVHSAQTTSCCPLDRTSSLWLLQV